MFSFAYTSEHINGIKGNLFATKQISLFYLSAPLTTLCGCCGLEPAEQCQGGSSGLLLGSGSAQSLLAQPPCPRWPSCLGCAGTLSSAALQGEQLHLKPGHQPTEKVPEPALCSSPQCSSSPWTPTARILLSLCQFLGWQQRDRKTCKPLPKDLPHLFFQAEARSKCFKVCSQS